MAAELGEHPMQDIRWADRAGERRTTGDFQDPRVRQFAEGHLADDRLVPGAQDSDRDLALSRAAQSELAGVVGFAAQEKAGASMVGFRDPVDRDGGGVAVHLRVTERLQ